MVSICMFRYMVLNCTYKLLGKMYAAPLNLVRKSMVRKYPSLGVIHDSHEIAILEFPTSDCSQNEAWCHAKRTDVTAPIENTWRRPNQHCKFNALVARIDDHSIVFNYAVCARCYHSVLNWPATLSERFVWCLKMTFNTRYRWKRGAHARAARRRVGCTQSKKIPHKISFCVNTTVSWKMRLK